MLLVDAWCGGINVGEAYVDGGAHISVMTQVCMERLGLKMNAHSNFRLRLDDHLKVKNLGICTGVIVNVFWSDMSHQLSYYASWFGSIPTDFGQTMAEGSEGNTKLEEGNHFCA